jgi:hypothetical protein
MSDETPQMRRVVVAGYLLGAHPMLSPIIRKDD